MLFGSLLTIFKVKVTDLEMILGNNGRSTGKYFRLRKFILKIFIKVA